MKKILIIIAVLIFILLAAVEIYVQSDDFTARIRPYVLEPLKTVLGPEARIGRVKAHFFPPYLEVRDIILPDVHGNAVASIRKVTVYLNPVPLLVKKIRIPSISVLEPHISLERAPDGTFNIAPLVERIKANIAQTGESAPTFSLLLKTIKVRQGEIRFKDDGLSSRASITGLDMTARFNVAGDHVSVDIRGSHVTVSAPAYPEMTGTLKTSAEYDSGRIRLHSFELVTGDTSIAVSGVMGLLPDSILDLKVKVRSGPQSLGKLAGILKPAQKRPEPRVDASLAITGKTSDPQVSGDCRFSDIAYQGVTLRDAALSFRYHDHVFFVNGDAWNGAINGKALRIDKIAAELAYHDGVLDLRSVEAASGDLVVRMRGTVDQAHGFDAELAVESSGAGKTLSVFIAEPIGGHITMEGRLTGALNAPQLDGTVTAGPISVRGVQFDHVEGNLTYRGTSISLASVDIRRQTSRYLFDGALDFGGKEPVYSARLKVIQSDVMSIVALFYKPSLPLKLSASGSLSFKGTLRNYSGDGSLMLDAGSVYGESFTHGVVTASLRTGKVSFPRVELHKKKGMAKATGWIGFDGTYSADLESQDISLSSLDYLAGMALEGNASLEIHSAGSFTAPVVTASVDVEEFSVRQMAVGQLHGDAELRDGQLKATAELSEKKARLSIQWLLHKPYNWTAEAKITTDGINPLLLFGRADLAERVKVIADGAVAVHGMGLDRSSLSGEVVFSHIAVVIGDYRIDSESPPSLAISGSRIAIKSLNFTGPSTRINVTGRTDISNDIDITVKGTANLPLLKMLLPVVEYAAGTAEMKLTVTDEWSNPNVTGELRIRDGEIKISDIPQRFTAINGAIIFTEGRIATESITSEMGGGKLGVSGWVQLAGSTLQDFSVKSTVDNVTVRYPEGLTSTLSGNLFYDGSAQTQTVSGDILIRRARYDKPIEWKSMVVDIGRGLYQKKKAAVGWIGDTQINVWFHGNDSIQFQNNLARMPLDVDVFIRGTVNHPQLLGRIESRKGFVYFRNNEFKIIHASADFIDPNRMNPVLDFRAETQVREYLIQLSVTGTAERAVITFLSDPALNDTDILSMLALGKKSTEITSQGKSSIGVGEAASIATGQFQDILSRHAQSLTGLDRFQVDPYVSKNDTSVPRVTVGKELVQNKVYLTYSSNVGAQAPEQNIRLEYILNRHWSLVGEEKETETNGTNIGADIKYRFEFQ